MAPEAVNRWWGPGAGGWDDSEVVLGRMAEGRCVARRSPWQRCQATDRMPAAAARKAARQ